MFVVDVILRTHNRAAMLREAVSSFFSADHRGLEARLVVVDNASTDGTAAVVRELAERHGLRFLPLFEPRPGGQHALNRAIAAASAPVLAFFDDDERIGRDWLRVIAREFADPATDYIAGPVQPLGTADLPAWLPSGFGGVLGIIDSGPERRCFGPGFPGMLTQGNCAVRREVFERAGAYPEILATAEDRWLHQWLERDGRQGFYCPELLVEHVMQPERMTRRYFRQWARREGRDMAACGKLAASPARFHHAWYWRHLAASVLNCFSVWKSPALRFRGELDLRVELSYLLAVARQGLARDHRAA